MTLASQEILQGLLALLPFAGIALAVMLQGFFEGSETGAYRVNRVRLLLAARGNRRGARSLTLLVNDMPGLICVTLIGSNAAMYVSTSLTTSILEARWQDSITAEIAATAIMTPILSVFAQTLPKNLFNAEADRLMYGSARVLYVMRVTLGAIGLVGLLKGAGNLWHAARRRLRQDDVAPANPFPAQARLRSVFHDSAAEGLMTPYQNELVEKIMNLRDVHVSQALVPASRVVTVRADLSLEEFRELVRTNPYSRLPVVEPGGDEVFGIVVVRDVLERLRDGVALDLIDFVRLPAILTPDMSVTQAMVTLRRDRSPMALVRTEAGQYIGIVTLKDLAEEIVGELEAW
jgi:CBS domain containing-hemolysin-like protein